MVTDEEAQDYIKGWKETHPEKTLSIEEAKILINDSREYDCIECEDGKNLIKGSECFHCGNTEGQLEE